MLQRWGCSRFSTDSSLKWGLAAWTCCPLHPRVHGHFETNNCNQAFLWFGFKAELVCFNQKFIYLYSENTNMLLACHTDTIVGSINETDYTFNLRRVAREDCVVGVRMKFARANGVSRESFNRLDATCDLARALRHTDDGRQNPQSVIGMQETINRWFSLKSLVFLQVLLPVRLTTHPSHNGPPENLSTRQGECSFDKYILGSQSRKSKG